jgi:hypothetical protein
MGALPGGCPKGGLAHESGLALWVVKPLRGSPDLLRPERSNLRW